MPPFVEMSGSRLRIRGSQNQKFSRMNSQPNLFYEASQRGQAVGCGSLLLAK